MSYIVLDLEWNQSRTAGGAIDDCNGNKLHGEIIQIGAVRLDERFSPSEEFGVRIRPKYYTKIHRKVMEITGINQRSLESGIDFPTAISQFKSWCGEDCVFLTWGPDDIRVLRQNIELYGKESAWVDTWFNVQSIFNAQTDGGSNQKALTAAMEHFDIPADRPLHDALNDAYYTACICARLDMPSGIAAIIHGASDKTATEQSAPLVCEMYTEVTSRRAAFEDSDITDVRCPVCGEVCASRRTWLFERGGRFITLASCAEHGDYIARLRLSRNGTGTLNVSKMIYGADSFPARTYSKCAKAYAKRRRAREQKSGL